MQENGLKRDHGLGSCWLIFLLWFVVVFAARGASGRSRLLSRPVVSQRPLSVRVAVDYSGIVPPTVFARVSLVQHTAIFLPHLTEWHDLNPSTLTQRYACISAWTHTHAHTPARAAHTHEHAHMHTRIHTRYIYTHTRTQPQAYTHAHRTHTNTKNAA